MRSGVFIGLVALAISTGVNAADYNFDYQGQSQLGLAPVTPEEAEKCRQNDEAAATDVSTDATEPTPIAPAAPAPVNPAVKTKPIKAHKDAKSKALVARSKSEAKVEILSASTDLEKKRRCGALTDAALGTANFIHGHALVASGTNMAGILAAGALVGGAIALGVHPSGGAAPNNVPIPLPGAGLLSYLAIAASGAFVWMRRRFASLMNRLPTTKSVTVATAAE